MNDFIIRHYGGRSHSNAHAPRIETGMPNAAVAFVHMPNADPTGVDSERSAYVDRLLKKYGLLKKQEDPSQEFRMECAA